MPFFPTVRAAPYMKSVTDTFLGLDRRMKIPEGAFSDMENLTSSYYPLLSNRDRRGTVMNLKNPKALLQKKKLVLLDQDRLYFGGEDITSYLHEKGCFIDPDGKKQLVSFGAYIVLFPDMLYLNTEDFTDCGSLEAVFEAGGAAVTFSMCRADGEAVDAPAVGSTAPENPGNGARWIDTAVSPHVLKTYSAEMKMWVEDLTVYVKLSCTGIGKNFSPLDGVTISGCTGEAESLNGHHILTDTGEDFLIFPGLIHSIFTAENANIKVVRSVPELDFVTEAENRLWGCKYGLVNGKTVNEIYASALGDFKNWNRFEGISTDSYRASVGTDGAFTGAVTFLGHPVFFKENCLHKVFISAVGAHSIAVTACRGVQKGSEKSLAIVNETLFFKSVTDICAYDGSLPVSVSEPLGQALYTDAAAGAVGGKYYISMKDEKGSFHLFVFDTQKGFWHREDGTHAAAFAKAGDELYFADADRNLLMAVRGSVGVPEDTVRWCAETGIIGCGTVEQKYVSRLNLRMRLPKGSFCDMFIEYDSDGLWIPMGHIEGKGTDTFMLPLRPRRCDHFRFKIVGEGDVRVFSFSKILETGSDA